MRPPPWERMRSGATATTNAIENATENATLAPTNAAPTATSKTCTRTIIGRHEHVISGYSLLKGIGDGEPIASDRFMVGGHEWVLLFYPDGKRSMSDGNAANAAASCRQISTWPRLLIGHMRAPVWHELKSEDGGTISPQEADGRSASRNRHAMRRLRTRCSTWHSAEGNGIDRDEEQKRTMMKR